MKNDQDGTQLSKIGSSERPRAGRNDTLAPPATTAEIRQIRATIDQSQSPAQWTLSAASETCLRALNNWNFADDLPAGIDDGRIAMAIAELDAGLIPASPAQAAPILGKLFATVGCPAGMDSDAASAAYLEAFDDVPLDILAAACRLTAKSCRFAPKPADIRDHINAPLSLRHYQRRRLDSAALKWRQEAPARQRAADIAAERAAGRNLYSLDDVRAAVKRVPDEDGGRHGDQGGTPSRSIA